jgi:hypothetical protein
MSKNFKQNKIKKFRFVTASTIGDGSCIYRAVAFARRRLGHQGFEIEEAAVRAMWGEVQVYLRQHRRTFEGALMYNALEENFKGTEAEMVEFSLGRVLEIDSWAGEEAIFAYSAIN